MYYALTHLTRFTYNEPVTGSITEVQMKPRSDQGQRCIQFSLNVSPDAHIQSRRNHLGNVIHVFDIHGKHRHLAIKTESLVQVEPPAALPDALNTDAWDKIDTAAAEQPGLYDMLLPSHFARPSDELAAFAAELGVSRDEDPLSLLRRLTSAIYDEFAYTQNITRADSPIEDALRGRVGVCQDFAHIMIALARKVGLPCRYISGYLYHRRDEDRSAADATHAWVEAWLPEYGWVGFDPTNNLICNEQHIRVAIGRDYKDVPPTRGVFVGEALSTLEVEVKVSILDELPAVETSLAPEIKLPNYGLMPQQQQQQQQ